MRIAEQIVHKLRRRRHVLVPRRSVHRQHPRAVFKPRRKNQRRKIAAVIDMKMAEEKNIQLRHLRSALSKAQRAASSCIHHHACTPVLPDQITGRRALVLQLRPARPEHLHRQPFRPARLRHGERRAAQSCE
jgi:hypothetical protein